MHRFVPLASLDFAGHRPGQIAAVHVVLGAGPRGHHRIVVERHGTGCADGLCADHAHELRAAPADALERLVVALLREALAAAPAAAAAARTAAPAAAGEDAAQAAGTAAGHEDEDFAGEF